MALPIEVIRGQYSLLGRTIDSAARRLRLKSAQPDQEALVIQGAYLFGVRAFEYFLESQMVYLCDPATVWGPKVVGGLSKRFVRKISNANGARVKALLSMGKSYADYLPIDRTMEKATVLFAGGRPFSLLEAHHLDVIKRSHVVRNLIAHESDHAMTQFKRVVCSRYPLRAELQNANGYLMHERIKGLPMAKQDLAGLLEAAGFLA